MKLIEYRILMPLKIEENGIGVRFSFTEVERINTGGGEGVVVLQDKIFKIPFDKTGHVKLEDLPLYEDYNTQMSIKKHAKNKSGSLTSLNSHPMTSAFVKSIPEIESKSQYGLFTQKQYRVASKVPWFIRKVVPKDMLILNENAWNMYPHLTKTVLVNEFLKTKTRLEFDTIVHECPTGEPLENAHNLSAEMLKKREVINIDITEPVTAQYYKEEEDPCKFKSVKTGRGQLVKDKWVNYYRENNLPLICIYKLVLIEFRVTGMQSLAENYCKNTYKEFFSVFHRQIFCWIDRWHGLNETDLRRIEGELAITLGKKINEGEKSQVNIQEDSGNEKDLDPE